MSDFLYYQYGGAYILPIILAGIYFFVLFKGNMKNRYKLPSLILLGLIVVFSIKPDVFIGQYVYLLFLPILLLGNLMKGVYEIDR